MADFFHPMTTHTCRVQRRCVYCGEFIEPGDTYCKQSGVWEGKWFTSHYHPECFDDMCDVADGEFIPYSNERPAGMASPGAGRSLIGVSQEAGKRDTADHTADAGKLVGLGFVIEDGTLRYTDGGCHPATDTELAMWDALQRRDTSGGASMRLVTVCPLCQGTDGGHFPGCPSFGTLHPRRDEA